jgi:hypothetical protein
MLALSHALIVQDFLGYRIITSLLIRTVLAINSRRQTMTEIEHLRMRVLANEAMLVHLAELISAHLPATKSRLQSLFYYWNSELDKAREASHE